MTAVNVKDDPVLRSPEQRDAIAKATAERKHEACTRRACTVAEAVSIEALCAQYPQVRRIVEENDRLRDAAGDVAKDLDFRAESIASVHAMTARILWEGAEKLKAAIRGE
jgi:hypothetical protein